MVVIPLYSVKIVRGSRFERLRISTDGWLEYLDSLYVVLSIITPSTQYKIIYVHQINLFIYIFEYYLVTFNEALIFKTFELKQI